ncbi:MAG: hypothetical protein V4580_05155 [Bacteroidota bacterium]
MIWRIAIWNSMRRGVFFICFGLSLIFLSCEKEYTCVCTSKSSGNRCPGDKVKTTKLGKKGFEKSCKSTNDDLASDLKDCHVE